ncbi:hypothetical protein pneo_cds_265 [Pandoravirus neocaledonia]|uniref:mRNA 5'-phosphatase n=1 Tax=Pandoravirus neocaledonia TaxID=2107708 RepID=A0A2U7UBV5_9VIRU|nr:hypothetical protein pneo_cds_265 [Pandoravirus neocaledonia]AVK75872.1 hypothetical protein pneo_cds_265 [Pandoravirus neocaledonia]
MAAAICSTDSTPVDPAARSVDDTLTACMPHLAGAISALVPTAALMRKVIAGHVAARGRGPRGARGIELEARLGTVGENGSFEPGVEPTSWYAALALLEMGDAWDEARSHGWREDHVTHYVLPLTNEPVRTIASYGKERISVVHQHKKVIEKRTFLAVAGDPSASCCAAAATTTSAMQTGGSGGGAAAAARCKRRRRGYDVRVALSREEQVLPNRVPNVAHPEHVAIRQRRRFASGAWAVDLTMVWSGRTKEEAEQRQRRGPAQYHIEVECIDPVAYLDSHAHDVQVAASVLMRIVDLVDPEATARNLSAGLPMGTAPGAYHYHPMSH